MLVDPNKEEVIVPPAEETVEEEQEFDVLDEIEKAKKDTVPLSEFKKVKNELNGVYKRLLNGETIEAKVQQTDEAEEMKQLRKDLFGKDITKHSMTNLEYWKKTLRLRELSIKNNLGDPFLATGFAKKAPTKEDRETAQNIADTMQMLIDKSEGDPDQFNGLYRSKRYIAESDIVIPKK